MPFEMYIVFGRERKANNTTNGRTRTHTHTHRKSSSLHRYMAIINVVIIMGKHKHYISLWYGDGLPDCVLYGSVKVCLACTNVLEHKCKSL